MSKIYKENYHRESKYGLKETNSLSSFLQIKICTCITISEAQHE